MDDQAPLQIVRNRLRLLEQPLETSGSCLRCPGGEPQRTQETQNRCPPPLQAASASAGFVFQASAFDTLFAIQTLNLDARAPLQILMNPCLALGTARRDLQELPALSQGTPSAPKRPKIAARHHFRQPSLASEVDKAYSGARFFEESGARSKIWKHSDHPQKRNFDADLPE